MATNKNFEIKNGLTIAGTERITGGGAFTGGLSDDSVGSDQLAANLTLTGNAGVTLPSGTTSERPGSPAAGVMRLNTTTDVMEYYDGTNWQGLDTAPTVISISPTTILDANANIVITGRSFKSGVTVKFIGNDGTEYNSPSVTFNSITQITATTPSSPLTVANEPYDIKVINPSGVNSTLENALDAGSIPVFGVASGTVGTALEGTATSGFTQITATDADSQSLTISLKSGSALPSGVSMSTSGVFSGNLPTTGSGVTTSFTVQVTDGANIVERDYTMTARVAYYAVLSGSGTWSVPSGVNAAQILIVAGGASGSKSENVGGAGGGAGGIVYRSSYTFTSTDKSSGVAYAVGAGGNGVGISPLAYDGGYTNGGDSTFALSGGTITAKGGGGGGGYAGQSPHYTGFSNAYYPASAGGSGGGGAHSYLSGGASNQGTFSGWTSYGNAGGAVTGSSGGYPGGGGGGAGAVGDPGVRSTHQAGDGGVGVLFSDFTSYGQSGYFGGGGAGGKAGNPAAQGGNGGGGIGGNGQSGLYVYSGGNAVDGTGGGGGGVTASGSYGNYNTKGGDGGNGTIIIQY